MSFGVTVEGAYLAALGVAGAGLLLLVLAVELLRPRGPRRPDAPSLAGPGVRPRDPATPTAWPAPVRRPGARKAARPGRRTRTTAAAPPPPSPWCSSRAGASSREPSTQEAATLARTKVSLTEDDLPALYASYDERRARAVRRAGPPAYREGPWRRRRPRAGAGRGPLRDGGPAHHGARARARRPRTPGCGSTPRGSTPTRCGRWWRRAPGAATPRCT